MAESIRHMTLVARMRDSIVSEYFHGDSGMVLVDDALTSKQRKPPIISGYIPDIFGEDPKRRLVVIGEAKTAQDVENRHTRDQLVAFLRFCASRDNSVLVVAVPWHLTRYARQMVKSLAVQCHATAVPCVVLDRLEG